MRLIARCISLTAWSSSNLHKTLPYSGQAASKIQLPPEKAVAGKEFLQNEELKLLGYIFELTVMHKLLWHLACYHADSLSIRVHHILLTLTGNPTCYQLQRPFVQHTHCSQVSDGGAAAIFMSEEAMSFFVADLFVGTLKLGKLLWMPGLEEVWPDSWVCSGDCGFRLWSRQSMAEAVKHHPKKKSANKSSQITRAAANHQISRGVWKAIYGLIQWTFQWWTLQRQPLGLLYQGGSTVAASNHGLFDYYSWSVGAANQWKIDVWRFYTNLNLYYENPGIDVGKHSYRPFLSVTLQHASPKKSLAPCLQGSLPHVEEGWSTTRWARSCWSPWLLRIRSESCRACENCFCQLVALHINYA